MKPARTAKNVTPAIGDVVVVRAEVAGVIVRRRVADPARRARLVRLLALLLDKPTTPGEGRPE